MFLRTSPLLKQSLLTKGKRTRAKGGKMVFYLPKPQVTGEPPKPFVTNDPKSGWNEKYQRTGVLAMKIGMTADWDNFGVRYPLTVLQVPNCQVVQVKTPERDGYLALQVGAGLRKLKNVPKTMMGHLAAAGVPPKRKLTEFHVSKEALVPVGSEITARHFIPGQFIDVQGKTKGKGFQGAMKRWGFAGLPASHGTSISHRSLGATGARQDPGKVWKGKKMAGHMGNATRTTKNLRVFEVIPDLNCIVVIGSVPGPAGSWLRLRDSVRQTWTVPPPFPTFVSGKSAETPLRITNPKPFKEEEEGAPADDQWLKSIKEEKEKLNLETIKKNFELPRELLDILMERGLL